MSATGHHVKQYGMKKVESDVNTATQRKAKLAMAYNVMDVRRPIISASATVATGKAIWFSSRGRGICADDDFSFDPPDNHLPLIPERGVYKLAMTGCQSGQLMPLEERRSGQADGDIQIHPMFGRAKRLKDRVDQNTDEAQVRILEA